MINLYQLIYLEWYVKLYMIQKIGNTRMIAYKTTEYNSQNTWFVQPEPIELLIVNEQTGKLLQCSK